MNAEGKKTKHRRTHTHTHAVERTKTHKTHSRCEKVSCPSPPPRHSLSYAANAHLPTFLLHVKHGRVDVEAVPFHSTSGSDQRASWKLRPLGLLITMLLNSGSDSSQRMSLCLLNTKVPTSPAPPPFLERTTLTFKK